MDAIVPSLLNLLAMDEMDAVDDGFEMDAMDEMDPSLLDPFAMDEMDAVDEMDPLLVGLRAAATSM
eukprot:scaffold73919_cov14-Tisochrysis_lutea.AAC.1